VGFVRFMGLVLGLLALACFARGFWVILHGGSVVQFVLLEGTALILASGAGWFWENGSE
jgi:hypothetical protein